MKFKMFDINIKPVLTKQQKQEWITALESSKYRQIKHGFHRESNEETGNFIEGHCCLAVFHNINKTVHWADLMNSAKLEKDFSAFVKINDEHEFPEARDYSNILPLIKQLPTID